MVSNSNFGTTHTHSRWSLCLLRVTVFILLGISTQVSAEGNGKCQFQKYSRSDPSLLAKAEKRILALEGKSYKSFYNETYEFDVGVCADLGNPQKPNAGVLQVKIKGEGQGTAYMIGTLADTHITAGTDWVMLEYKGGDTYGSHCGGEERRAVIMITCDPYTDDSNARMVYMQEENSKDSDCYYLFEMQHKAVCPEPSSSGLSVGSILVIVFFCVVAVYLVVGFLYQRFVMGSKGVEQIPNYDFWKDFGNLQADGCDLVCRSKGRQRAGHFGGIGDEQLDPVEEVRDDNLLPM